MSSLINKVKDAIHSDKSNEQPEGTHGTHNSRAANAADPRLDSDRDGRAAPGGTTGSTATHGGLGANTGSHGVGGPTHGTSGTTGLSGTGATGGFSGRDNSLPEGTTGPHSSRAANAADPRVDSDLDSSRRHGAGGLGGTTGSSGLTGTGATGGFSGRDNSLPEGTTGPHGSRLANAADPRVDSDLDSSRRHGAGAGAGTGALGGHSNEFGSTGGYAGRDDTLSHGTHGTSGLDSSRHQAGLGGAGAGLGGAGTHAHPNTYEQTTTGTSGFSSHGAGAHGPSGTHSSGLSGTGAGSHGAGVGGAGSGYGTGPAPGTAGPHKSDALNKADPRVDSDLDGSKTVGKEKTFEQSNDYSRADPTDAAQVPPSVLQKHVPSEIPHDQEPSDHGRRHSVSHQEKHRGL